MALVLIALLAVMLAFGIFRIAGKARREREIYRRRWTRGDDGRSEGKYS